uniref:non-specific serine/threonine protein kinase n=1 Tax=Corethron hystrix TaxID=216773 RepID=A0A7S1C0W6_9STRA|mmetsp:Transcript_8155/g.17720  ORF Transcript_8155/g.17720 Transcript_8155/m.17720 type:complete len:616 (+) Transcript_8155:201-2048(+)|eukprot:CAMPEP_0113308090 /NCGR_PEP_ID=MMETSP0010_2-20120614/6667_1 /TAXON_ID=216773 ORGANISM="Corethron hystrix, Strain 308" /NCGR_SAMPLE_ID=MMETSP0010_2 /ASSEMBLY_ACC=CAM_ASM_000155 /LENGTH=615 /DNA_ID=CAMNT_0000163061 /DNA_START=126 /DNA_END=1973 /DNA_ORIENTATION=+ /assembly_acc=CAM_ASM_000155
MKLDATILRTLPKDALSLMAAIEKYMVDHTIVPTSAIIKSSGLRTNAGHHKILSALLRDKLVHHEGSGGKAGYDGYRLTNAGYDLLALYHLKTAGIVTSFGDRIGVGKESDIYLAMDREGRQVVLKFHRLGRTSFRAVAKKRDYFADRSSGGGSDVRHVRSRTGLGNDKRRAGRAKSWLFLSKRSALLEYAFLKALYDVGFPTPVPIGYNRHVVVMGLVRGVPLYQIRPSTMTADQRDSIYKQSMELGRRMAKYGLVHCDLNEFNLMVDLSGIQSSHSSSDPYVRHCGADVTHSVAPGALSGTLHGACPVDSSEAHHDAVPLLIDGTGEVVTEKQDLTPAHGYLDDGRPVPSVTLIDFPQMVSTGHPNATELYIRDIGCLRQFFVKKMKCEDDWSGLLDGDEMEKYDPLEEEEDEQDNDGFDDAVKYSWKVLMESVVDGNGRRVDQEVKASGYSEDSAARDMELYYFEHGRNEAWQAKEHEVDDEDCSENDDDNDENDDDNDDDEGSFVKSEQSKEDVDAEEDIVPDEMKDPHATVATAPRPPPSVSAYSAYADMDREELKMHLMAEAEVRARQRVRQLRGGRKGKGGANGNKVGSRNTNKCFVKGRRVMKDMMC